MRFNKKIFFSLFLIFLLSSTLVLAFSSSDYFSQAQRYIDQNCNKPNLSDKTSLECYLFLKVNESGGGGSSSAAIHVFDANGSELGVFASFDTFFYPALNIFVPIDVFSGLLGYWNNGIFYSDENCTGTAYLPSANINLGERNNHLISHKTGQFYILDKSIPIVNTNVKSFQGTFYPYAGIDKPCENVNATDNYWTLKTVPFPLTSPVALPLNYKYQ